MFQNFPYTDMHQLNLDWIIKIAKDFLDQYTHIQQLIQDGETSLQTLTTDGLEQLQTLTTEGLEQLQDKADNLEALLQEWYNTHSDDIAEQLASALADITSSLNNAIAAFSTQATQIGANVIASIPEDYSILYSLLDTVKQSDLQNDFDPDNATLGAYCNASGGITNNEKLCYYKIPCAKDDIIYFKNFDYNTFGQTFGCVFDSSDNFLWRLTYPHADGYVTIEPAAASYVLVNCSMENMYNFMVFKNYNYQGTAYIPHNGITVNENRFSVYYNNELKNMIPSRKAYDILLHSGFIDNAYVNRSGEIVTTSASAVQYRIYTIPVKKGQVLRMSGKFDVGIQVPLFATFNNGSFVNKYLYQPSSSARVHTNQVFIVPDGVTDIYFTIQKTYADYYKCYVEIDKNKLSDRTWTIIGDSISSFKGHAHQLYSDLIAVETGITITNLASSGMGYKNGNDPFYSQALRVPLDCDIVTVMGSINDAPYTLGTKDDTGTDTIGGCINSTIVAIYDRKVNAHIGLITPPPTATNMPWDENCFLSKLSTLIIEIARKRGIPVLDLFHCSNLRPNIASFRAVCFTDDTGGADDPTHPNTEGHKMISNIIRSFIESI